MRTIRGKVLAGAVAAAAALMFASQADAGWRWHGSSGGGWGSGGGYGSSGGWGGSSGGWGGSSGGWGGGWHHAKRHHRGWGSSGGWGGSSGGWGGSSGGWGSSGGGAFYGSGFDAYPVDPSLMVPPGYGPVPPGYPAPGGTLPPAGAPLPGAPVPGPGGLPPAEASLRRADGLLAVSVPEDAKVYVNGLATTSTGNARQYVSRDLTPGYNYNYEVRAEVVRDGRTLDQVKTVNVRAGDTASLAFDFPASQPVETSLTLHVPADAKVYLAGNPTKASGETRVFRTTGLTSGDAWDSYTVRVELDRGGRTLTKEETIRLRAGQSQELSFDFDGDKIASR